jgi:hypothetical protein
MPRSRLYRSIVVFGTTLGAGAPIVAAALAPACDLYEGPSRPAPPDAWHATIADAWHGIIDAPTPPDAWPTIADAPNPDARVDGPAGDAS